jgi:hypothetical protein
MARIEELTYAEKLGKLWRGKPNRPTFTFEQFFLVIARIDMLVWVLNLYYKAFVLSSILILSPYLPTISTKMWRD